ncbi:hypothetical protein RCH12_002093 [Cryobacterium sp. MP_3.1]|uniref:hypothetical protein n=1 Tax=Cryobacterium sp. MP_3.1 TaxID=3071711 RepID=UPI002DF9C8AE|nr:hypothetical protein [Cryobacterium sp. MP_3.1]
MTTLNTKMSFRQTRTVGLLGTSLVVALLVAGCSSPKPEATKEATTTPTASATPTPTALAGTVEAPQSAEEAIAGATAAAETYLDVRAEIETEHPEDSSAIESVAMGEVAADTHTNAATLAEEGTILSGSYSYDITTSYATDLTSSDGTVFPFTSVNFEGCFSSEGISATNADGSPVGMSTNRRGVVEMSVFYVAAEATWLVEALRTPQTGDVPC